MTSMPNVPRSRPRASVPALAVAALTLTLGGGARPALAAEPPEPDRLDGGLVTALDRVGGNLLGRSAFRAVLQEPPEPDEPQRVRLYLSTVQAHPVEIVLVTTPSEVDPPEPDRAFARITVGGPEGLKLEFDPSAGEIDPCWKPTDLSGIAAAPTANGKVASSFRAGLVTALGEVGGNLLGGSAFRAALADPPEPEQPQRLRLFVSKTAPFELVLAEPPDPDRAAFRIEMEGRELELMFDPAALGSREAPRVEPVDLTGLADPPDPERQ
jgi:hypothetical protein